MAAQKILIVGGVAGGASAATRARRMNEAAEIIIFEKGDEVSFANCGMPYYIGGQIKDRSRLLMATASSFKDNFCIQVRTWHEVKRIDPSSRRIEVLNHRTGESSMEHYDQLILAPGAWPVMPSWGCVDCPNLFVLRDLGDADRIRACVDGHQPKQAVVVGGGYIGLEMVEVLVGRGIKVTLLELQEQIMPPLDCEMAGLIENVLRERGVELCLNSIVEGLVVKDGRVSGVRLVSGPILPADMVLLSMGVRPNVELAVAAGLALGSQGGIAVNEHLQTSDPAIYAVGDAAEVVHLVTGKRARIPLAGPANRNGRLAGQHAAVGAAPLPASVAGSAIVGVFGKAAAMTGLSLKAARRLSGDCSAVYAIRGHHAGYYPGAEQMVLKLVFDTKTRRILGAQAVGGGGVDKRIDIIATLMHFKGTIDDLAGLDLTYAPQFGAAKDPVHIAAFVAQNQADGRLRQILPGDPAVHGQLVDVRTPAEVAAGTLPGAVNIPLQRLRENLGQLNKQQPITVFCQVGQRGYMAARILMQSGFQEVWNLAGGYILHKDSWAKSINARA